MLYDIYRQLGEVAQLVEQPVAVSRHRSPAGRWFESSLAHRECNLWGCVYPHKGRVNLSFSTGVEWPRQYCSLKNCEVVHPCPDLNMTWKHNCKKCNKKSFLLKGRGLAAFRSSSLKARSKNLPLGFCRNERHKKGVGVFAHQILRNLSACHTGYIS